MANEEHMAILKQGVEVWNEWRKENPSIEPDFSRARLAGADLKAADLTRADLIQADLRRADLRESNLRRADLRVADLRRARLKRAILREADLRVAKLSGANFRETDLREADLSRASLKGADLRVAKLIRARLIEVDLSGADLRGANFREADLSRANLGRANLSRADLRESQLIEADLFGTIFDENNFSEANLSGANLNRANLSKANFSGADLSGADLSRADLREADLREADLRKANLTLATLVDTRLDQADLIDCEVYGISIWNVSVKGTQQKNLVITRPGEPTVTVDNLEVAQFIYLMLNNDKVRSALETITTKSVLILGRFSWPMKDTLDAIREKLREMDYLPIMFDFERLSGQDYTETIRVLAGMSKFVIADLSGAKSIQQELQAIIPDFELPVVPIIQQGEEIWSMFESHQRADHVLPVVQYADSNELITNFEKVVILRAEKKYDAIIVRKAKHQIEVLSVDEVLDEDG